MITGAKEKNKTKKYKRVGVGVLGMIHKGTHLKPRPLIKVPRTSNGI